MRRYVPLTALGVGICCGLAVPGVSSLGLSAAIATLLLAFVLFVVAALTSGWLADQP